MAERIFLVIRADRSMRFAKKPRLAWDEIAVGINVTFPEGWGKVIGNIDITAPDFDPTIEYAPVGDE